MTIQIRITHHNLAQYGRSEWQVRYVDLSMNKLGKVLAIVESAHGGYLITVGRYKGMVFETLNEVAAYFTMVTP